MAKSYATVAKPPPPPEPVTPPETADVEVCVLRRKGNERFDVLRGVAKVPLDQLKVIDADVTIGVALNRRLTENAKIANELRRNPL